MEVIGQLAGGIAHDFNNILSAIIGYSNLVQIKLPSDDPVRKYVDQIVASSGKAAILTQSLLAFSRKQIIDANRWMSMWRSRERKSCFPGSSRRTSFSGRTCAPVLLLSWRTLSRSTRFS
jgi:hypothetical protein